MIGDVHGRDCYKKILKDNPDTDLTIFIGDYFDSFDIPAVVQIHNFKEIVAYKKENMDKVVLLTGNHCYHYLKTTQQRYSGYQQIHHIDIQELLNKALDEDLIQMCYISGNILFSHAGVTKTWCKDNDVDLNNLEQSINDLFKYKPNSFKFLDGNIYGDNIYQSPIWIRPNSLIKDKIDNYTQIVGHTQQNELTFKDDIILIDTLGTSGEYLVIIDDGKKPIFITKSYL